MKRAWRGTAGPTAVPCEPTTFALSPLVGAVTLETLGLMVNPLSRELVPMRLTLALLPV